VVKRNDSRLPSKVFYGIPSGVNFISKTIASSNTTNEESKSVLLGEDFAPLALASRVISANFLHKEIREKGGAYGSGMSINHEGVIEFYSYRDPNVVETLSTFDRAAEWFLSRDNVSQRDLDEAKLNLLTINPSGPGSKGRSRFLHGFTDEFRQKSLF